ncbi:MAG: PadR family transcriptional regulator [Caldilineaceae bacterium]
MIISKDLIAPLATPLILSILSHGDSYGYAIIQRVQRAIRRRDGVGRRDALSDLAPPEKMNWWSRISKAENGSKRKYYRLRQSGLEELNEQRRSWHSLYAMLQKLEEEVVCPT